MTTRADLLVVAGESSGDRAAAGVVHELAKSLRVRAFGMGGAALAAAKVDLVSDLGATTAMGIGEVALRSCAVTRAYRGLLRATKAMRPAAALLVNYTEFNSLLAAHLHDEGVRVLWYIAPQIWAWRPGRAKKLRRGVDRMAVVLPFEEELWRAEGVDAHYVGHPAREFEPTSRNAARTAVGLTLRASTIAILPGSRPHEVKKLLLPMLESYERVRRERASVDGRVLLAPSLDPDTAAWVRAVSKSLHVEVFEVDPRVGIGTVLRAFDVALCASGTASLEAALARAVPIVAYRVGLVTEVVARLALRTDNIALPNILLGRRAFPELLQRDVRTARLTETLAATLDRREELLAACAEVDECLGSKASPSREVAQMLEPWLVAHPETRSVPPPSHAAVRP